MMTGKIRIDDFPTPQNITVHIELGFSKAVAYRDYEMVVFTAAGERSC